MNILGYIASFCDFVRRGYNKVVRPLFFKIRLGYCGKNVNFRNTKQCPTQVLKRIYMYDDTTLNSFSMISASAKFIMKKESGASSGLTIITGNHQRIPCEQFKVNNIVVASNDIEKDIVVEEDVWIGANVTLCAGVTIGRCANIGAGSVVRNSVPPYAIVMGNPAKVVGFCFTPKEAVEHEKMFYAEEERIPFEILQKNYEKYFLKRIKEIKEFTKL